jgi:hypothetical protein
MPLENAAVRLTDNIMLINREQLLRITAIRWYLCCVFKSVDKRTVSMIQYEVDGLQIRRSKLNFTRLELAVSVAEFECFSGFELC